MKAPLRIIPMLVAAFIWVSPVFAQTTSADQKDITKIFSIIEQAIKSGDGSELGVYLAPDARKTLTDDIFYGLPFADQTKSVSITNQTVDPSDTTPNEVRYNATLTAQIHHSSRDFNGSDTYFFTFRKEDGKWYLYDTNFYKGLGSSFADQFSDAASSTAAGTDSMANDNPPHGAALAVVGGLLIFMVIGGIIALAFGIFWLWMFIEICTRPDFPHKVLWILLMLFFAPIASILYFFMEHRAYKDSLKNGTAPVAPAPAAAPAPAPAPTSEPTPPAPAPAAPEAPLMPHEPQQ